MRTLIAVTLVTIAKCCAFGANYFVSTNGSDAASGLIGAPWFTLSKVATTAAAGDTVTFSDGVFAGTSTTAANSGTAANPVVIQGTSRAATIISNHFTINQSHWVFTNLTFHQQIRSDNTNGNNVSFRNVSFKHAGHAVYMTWVPPHGPIGFTFDGCDFREWNDNGVIVFTGGMHTVTNCSFADILGYDVFRVWGVSNRISGSVFDRIISPTTNMVSYGNHADIFQTFGNSNTNVTSRNFLVERCLFRNGTAQLGNLDKFDSDIGDWTFRNNIFYRCGGQLNCYIPGVRFLNNTFFETTRETQLRFTVATSNLRRGIPHSTWVVGNIFARCSDLPSSANHGFYSLATAYATNCVIDYNMIYGTGGAIKNLIPGFDLHGINGGDALFVNESTVDFSLSTNSPAIAASTNLSAFFTSDYYGNTRTNWDIGAISFGGEFGSGGGSVGGPAASDSGRRLEASGLIHRRR